MELNYKDTTRYIFKCPFCNIRVPKFIIDFNKCNISIECRCDYKKQSIGLESVSKIIEKTKYSKFFCKNCKNILNFDFDNYICNDCNTLLCNNCSDNHFKNNNHVNKSIFNYYNVYCSKHNLKKNFFCDKCGDVFCEKCKISHIGHSIKSFTIPNQKQREFYRLNMDEYSNKITKLMNDIKNLGLFNEHYYIMNKYLKCLLIINELLLKKFNYEYLDYYNYLCFNYCYNYIELLLKNDNTKIINYIKDEEYNFDIDEINLKEKLNDKSQYLCEFLDVKNPLDFCPIQYENLFHYTDNLFFDKLNYDIYEYKDGYFNLIKKSHFRLDYWGQLSFKQFDFSDKFVLWNRKLISIVEYDKRSKNFNVNHLYDKDMYSKLNSSVYFSDIIDNKNGNIIIALDRKIKKKKYKIFQNMIFLTYDSLYNID